MKRRLNKPFECKVSIITKKTLIIFIVLTLFFSISSFVLSQSSPWPMFRHDPQHTGRSPYKGAEIDIFKWRLEVKDLTFSSPAIGSDGTIYIGGTHFYAVNPDGTLKWIFKTEGAIESSPAIGLDGTIYVGSLDENFYAINPDGTLKSAGWIGGQVVSSPAIGSDGTIYMGSENRNLYAIRSLYALRNGKVSWGFDTGSKVVSSPAIGYDGIIYIGGNGLYAVNPSDGTLKWEFKTEDAIESSPAIGSDGTIYVGSGSSLYAVNPDGTIKKRFSTGAKGWFILSSPAIGVDGTIYVGSSNIDVPSIWSIPGTSDVKVGNGFLYAIGNAVSSPQDTETTKPLQDSLNEMITWEKTYGGSNNDVVRSLIQTTDGGYAVAGYTGSKGAGNIDFWVIKLNEQGNQVWDRTYGGSSGDSAFSLIQTTDGGYAVAGYTGSKGAGSYDFWVIKLDEQGNQVWDRTYGGSESDYGVSLIQTTDGGYAVAGITESKGAGGENLWVIKLDEQGKIVWERTYSDGGSGTDCAHSLVQTTDGGYAVVGFNYSKGAGKSDFWLLKLDKQGNKNWDRTYGGSGTDSAASLVQTTDGGYVIVGVTQSKGAGGADFLVIKLDEQGNQVWDRTYGGSNNDSAASLVQTTDGGYAIAGFTYSKGAGKSDFWLLKLDKQGNKNWDRTYGGSGYDSAASLVQTTDGGYAVAGYTISKGSDKEDFWVIKLDEQGNLISGESDLDYDSQTETETTYSLEGSLHCPDTRGYPCDSCGPPPDYKNYFKGFNVLTSNEDCYVKLIYSNGAYIGNQNNCEVTIKGEKWLGLEDESGTTGLVKKIHKEEFDFKPYNQFVARTMNFPQDGYQYEFADEGREFRLYLSGSVSEAFQAVPWQNINIEIKNKETNKVFTYKFEKGIFPQPYAWSGGVANYGQCVWWAAKRWVEEVDAKTLFPFYPPSPQAVNVKIIDSNYKPKKYDVLIYYIPGGQPGHYGFVEKVDENLVYITQFNFIEPGEVYNYVSRFWNGNPKSLYYSLYSHNEYYFEYYYRSENK